MIGTVGAIVASAVIGVGGSMMAANAQSKAARSAAQAQVEAAKIAADAQREATDKQIAHAEKVYQQQREDVAPWREAGIEALGQLQKGIESGAFDPSDFEFEADPGYQWRLEQGQKAIERSAAASGRLNSGALGAALTEYGQGFASDEYDRAYARAASAKVSNFNNLASMAGVGQRAGEYMAGAAGQMGDRVGSAIGQLGQSNQNAAYYTGNALAQGHMGVGNAWANGFQNMAGAANTGIQNYLLYSMLG